MDDHRRTWKSPASQRASASTTVETAATRTARTEPPESTASMA
jgi:hypothetical protein